MADLFAEVDEMMRRERLEKIWRDYGTYIMAAIAAVILSTGAWSAYRSWSQNVYESQTAALITAMESENPAAALQTAARDMRPGLRAIALLTAAGTLSGEGNTEEAIALYQRAAEDEAIPEDLRGIATLSYIALASSGEISPEQRTQFQNDLKKIWSSGNNPWRFHARLQAAILHAGEDAYEQAAALLEPALEQGPQMPASLNAKINALHHVYALQSRQNKNTTEG